MDDKRIRAQVQHAVQAYCAGLEPDSLLASRVLSAARKKPVLKRKPGLVLALVLILMTVTALAVSALSGFVFRDGRTYGQPYAAAVWENRLYTLQQEGLFVLEPLGENALLVPRNQLPGGGRTPMYMKLAAEEQLLLVDTAAQTIWRWDGGAFVLLTGYADQALLRMTPASGEWVAADSSLFVQHRGSVRRIHLETGDVETLPLPGIVHLSPYRAGSLLALQEADADTLHVIEIQAASGETRLITEVPRLNTRGLAYAAKQDALYAMLSGWLSRWDGSAWQPVCAASLPRAAFFHGVFGDQYAAVSHEGIQFVPLQDAQTQQMLTIRGEAESDGYDHAFQTAHPGVRVARQTEWIWSAEDAVQAISAGDTADLYHVRLTSADWEALRHLLPPLDSPRLKADVEAMAPLIQDLVTDGGQLYAVPSVMIAEGWQSAKPLPGTMAELLSLGAWAVGQEALVGNDFAVLPWSREQYAAHLLSQALRERKAGWLRFADDSFVQLLEMLRQIPPDGYLDRALIASTAVSLAGYAPVYGQNVLPPVIHPQAQPTLPVTLTVYVLHPSSPNRELALAYLEHLAQNRHFLSECLMKPMDETSPQHQEVSESRLTDYRERLAPHLSMAETPDAAMLRLVLDCAEGQITPQECARMLERLADGRR